MSSHRFCRYTLPRLLPEDHAIVFDTLTGTMVRVDAAGDFLELQRFTPEEVYLLVELLNAYPHHASHAKLLSIKSQQPLAQCEELMAWAYEAGSEEMEKIIRPARSLLSRCRPRLHVLGLDILSLMATGYILAKSGQSLKTRNGGNNGR